MMKRDWRCRLMVCAAVPALLIVAAGCSIRRMAVNAAGDALAGGSSRTFATDNDPDLVKAAAPFSLKLMEALLEENPRHKGLRLTSASGFTQFAYAFVQQEADELEEKDLASAEALRGRARRLYLRARDHALRGLEATHDDFEMKLRAAPGASAQSLTRKDVPLVYWAAVSWAAAISLSKDNPDLVAEMPIVEALVDRALALDEAYDHGALHGFLITFEMSRPGRAGKPSERARRHFARAMELTGSPRGCRWPAC